MARPIAPIPSSATPHRIVIESGLETSWVTPLRNTIQYKATTHKVSVARLRGAAECSVTRPSLLIGGFDRQRHSGEIGTFRMHDGSTW
jgi:hypothetical protein